MEVDTISPIMTKEKAIIVDIDGTLAHIEHRVPFVRQDPPDWHNFMVRIPGDTLNYWCKEIVDAMIDKDYKIILITGRGEKWDDLSHAWLKEHDIKYDLFFSRKSGDRRPDEIIKKEIYQKNLQDKYEILFVLDDRLSVVKMWRDDLKLPTLQPEWGDF